jgi:hypothetical protein
MIEPSSSTLTIQGLRPFAHFGFYFECGTCHHIAFVTCVLEKDGTVSFDYEGNCYRPNWSQHKPFVAVTQGAKLSISCGVCRSGLTAVVISKNPVGIYFSSEKFEGDEQGRLLRERLEFFQ